jgi:hypothetical protein
MQTMCHDVFMHFERICARSQTHLVQRDSKVRGAVTVLAKRRSEWGSNAVSIDAAKKGERVAQRLHVTHHDKLDAPDWRGHRSSRERICCASHTLSSI